MAKTDSGSLEKSFWAFVGAHRCDSTEKTTHTILAKGGGKYEFTGKTYQEFLEKYAQIVTENKKVDLHFVEKPNKNGVTYLFLDIDYDHKGSKRLYTEEHIKQIIEKTNEFITDHFDVTRHQLLTLVTEKPKPTKRDNNALYKDGFHIYYPNLPMEEKHRFYVLDHLISCMVENEFLDGIDYQNDADKIFDIAIVKSNGILMFGSKKPGGFPYELTHVYDADLNEQSKDEYDDEELIYTLSNQRYDVDARVEALDDEELLEDIDNVYRQYGGGNKKKKTPDTRKALKDNDDYETGGHASDDDDDDNSEERFVAPEKPKRNSVEHEMNIKLAKELVEILSKKRATDYSSWRRVGFALRAIDESLYPEFVKFSKKNMAKYKEGKITCEDIWKAAADFTKFYSIGTLRHWARIDNNTEYYKLIRKMNDVVFGKAETGKHVDIAQVVFELYKDRFKCIDIQKKKWYEFQDHRWVFVQSAYTLEELISEDVRRMMSMYCSEKMRENAEKNELKDGFEQDAKYKKYKKMMTVIENLGDVNFRENVVRACANKFYDSEFQAKLDSNVYLVGFLNGVYDLKEGCFRDGLPSDYLSKTVGYEWASFTGKEPVFKKINKFFSEVQIDEDIRTYVLTFIAKSLRGIPDSKLHIWTGGGGNGKSATIDLIKSILGDYFGTVPVTILTKKRGASNSATPEMADKYGKRFLVVQEPEYNDVIQVGQMKEYTGKDQIMARPLYGDPFYYTPQFTMVLTCNNLPTIPANDNGTWRRLRVVPFDSEFVDDNPTKSHQFLKDEDLQEDFPNWVQPLMWLIITKYYPLYEKGYNGKSYKIIEPPKVKQQTDEYKTNSDVYAEFLRDNVTQTDSDKDIETIEFLHKNFKDWYVTSYSDKAPPKKILTAYLKKNGYKVERQNVYGVKFNTGLE
ncbi:D5-like helicase-primase [Yasminevirus sp. GU-2018]|uniref:D5-like helicase-primase n=1 Tax=Yasminevirus sp. GU-2018 TaxID=2420051 RepID=A0A5K0U8L5_9VIRU|nr:D5-like helicase-primase [Yasminevirus sp. GU-2018]